MKTIRQYTLLAMYKYTYSVSGCVSHCGGIAANVSPSKEVCSFRRCPVKHTTVAEANHFSVQPSTDPKQIDI
jgi:hypothetical protein